MHEFRCIGPRDLCASTQDCPDRQDCTWNPDTERRECISAGVCGRALLGGRAAAPAADRRTCDWCDAARPRVDHLELGEQAELAEHWTKLGQMEHASIAAFARFSLQLLSLGAPPDLVEACTRALADETEHAKLC